MQYTLVLLGLVALTAPCLPALASCPEGQFKCKDGSCTNSLYDKCDGVRNCRDGSDESVALCDAIPTTAHRLQDADKAVVSRVEFAPEHKAVELLMCTAEKCNKLAVNGAARGGAMSYSFYSDCNSLGGGPCVLNRSISPIDYKPLSGGPVQFVTMRLPKRWAIWLDGHLDKALVLPAPVCSDKLKIKPSAWTTDMPVTFSTVATSKFEKENAFAGLELPSTAKFIADTVLEALRC
ncbi:Low-density lipoprotein receptor-related protein 2 [Frankliniella fusca]|uniref:Low-density lipoprotein receptor-related protein 2 n=1 Tax=Frankliniella fusca TaxID=407009 RepID=A0AAE1L934_9NEOP|nr:Low-density lipoprotein receptor-related protein 2 [Frankliniella fusca]